jgi:hypothetical protein
VIHFFWAKNRPIRDLFVPYGRLGPTLPDVVPGTGRAQQPQGLKADWSWLQHEWIEAGMTVHGDAGCRGVQPQ